MAAGSQKHAAIRAALLGGWVDTLVTDTGTAEYLVSSIPETQPKRAAKSAATAS